MLSMITASITEKTGKLILYLKYLHVPTEDPLIIMNKHTYLYILLQICNLFGSQVYSIQ